jgi:hypothetical protein
MAAALAVSARLDCAAAWPEAAVALVRQKMTSRTLSFRHVDDAVVRMMKFLQQVMRQI